MLVNGFWIRSYVLVTTTLWECRMSRLCFLEILRSLELLLSFFLTQFGKYRFIDLFFNHWGICTQKFWFLPKYFLLRLSFTNLCHAACTKNSSEGTNRSRQNMYINKVSASAQFLCMRVSFVFYRNLKKLN